MTLEVANTLYVSNQLNMKAEYKDMVESYFKSYASELNFAKVKESVDIVNGWVNEKTHKKIPKLIDEGGISKMCSIEVLN